MLCTNCGKTLLENASFCTQCGAAVASADESDVNAAAEPTVESGTEEATAELPVAEEATAVLPVAETAAEPAQMPPASETPVAAAAAVFAVPASAGTPNNTYSAPAGTIPPYTQPIDQFDHTAEFSAQEISDGKLYAMMCYLLSWIGIIVAVLAAKENNYVMFHVRQSLKITVVSALVGIVTLLLFWTIIMLFVGGVCLTILFVLQIICFFQVCSGKAKEPAIIRNLGFLK